MLELTPKTRIEIQTDKEKKSKYLFSMKVIHRGHSIFEYNEVSGEIKKVDVEFNKVIGVNGEVSSRVRLEIKKDCKYFQALNEKNVVKKLLKLGFRNIKTSIN